MGPGRYGLAIKWLDERRQFLDHRIVAVSSSTAASLSSEGSILKENGKG
jgi:hypothetical protein